MSKEQKRKIVAFLLPPIANLLIRLIYLTCKKEFKLASSYPSEPFIVAFWHGELLMQPFLYKKFRGRHKISVMISEHFDGEIIARIISFFGFSTVRGSSSKGGARVLIEAIKTLKDGEDIAITPDGPRGPRHSVADGIVALAQKTNSKIVVFNYQATNFWQLKSWDKFVVPKPFSKITFFADKVLDISQMNGEEAKEFIKGQMLINAVK
ncbi:MAG: lysophospholipid acyltransferase family protein [Campylobacterales bacterium]